MWNWLTSLFTTKDINTVDVYKPKDRLIYKYWDGTKFRLADPMVLYKRISAKWATLSVDMKVAGSPSKDALEKHNSMIKTQREIFEVEPYKEQENSGLTELEVMQLFDDFMIYSGILKKNSSGSTTSQTETSPTSKSSEEEIPIILKPSPTGSLETEASIESRDQSQQV